jgi:hypothetical protein
LLEPLLLGQKHETVSHPQDGEGRTRAQAEILAESLGHGELAFFANLGSHYIFNGGCL